MKLHLKRMDGGCEEGAVAAAHRRENGRNIEAPAADKTQISTGGIQMIGKENDVDPKVVLYCPAEVRLFSGTTLQDLYGSDVFDEEDLWDAGLVKNLSEEWIGVLTSDEKIQRRQAAPRSDRSFLCVGPNRGHRCLAGYSGRPPVAAIGVLREAGAE